MVKHCFLYSAVSNPQDCSKRFTLYFPGRPVQWNTISTSLGSIQPYATINVWMVLVHISTTVYSHAGTHLYSWVNWSNVEWTNPAMVQHRSSRFGRGSSESYSTVWRSTPEPLRSILVTGQTPATWSNVGWFQPHCYMQCFDMNGSLYWDSIFIEGRKLALAKSVGIIL